MHSKQSGWLSWAVLVVVSGGCASAPISYASTTPQPLDATYACALSKVNELGYTVANTNKDAGFISASKQTSSGLGEFFSGKKTFDRLTVAIFDAPGGGKTLRVTAASAQQQDTGLFGNMSESGTTPSDKGKQDAQAILALCAPGPVRVGDDGATMDARIQ